MNISDLAIVLDTLLIVLGTISFSYCIYELLVQNEKFVNLLYRWGIAFLSIYASLGFSLFDGFNFYRLVFFSIVFYASSLYYLRNQVELPLKLTNLIVIMSGIGTFFIIQGLKLVVDNLFILLTYYLLAIVVVLKLFIADKRLARGVVGGLFVFFSLFCMAIMFLSPSPLYGMIGFILSLNILFHLLYGEKFLVHFFNLKRRYRFVTFVFYFLTVVFFLFSVVDLKKSLVNYF